MDLRTLGDYLLFEPLGISTVYRLSCIEKQSQNIPPEQNIVYKPSSYGNPTLELHSNLLLSQQRQAHGLLLVKFFMGGTTLLAGYHTLKEASPPTQAALAIITLLTGMSYALALSLGLTLREEITKTTGRTLENLV